MAPRSVPWLAGSVWIRFAVAASLASGAPLAAQAVGTLGIGASVVQYEGFLTSGAAVLAPALRFDTPRLSLAGQGNLTVFETGNEVVQGNLAAAWLAGSARRWRVELSGSAGASRYAAEPGSGHVLGGVRVHVFGDRAGGWVGATMGRTYGGRGVTPVELSVAGWRVHRRVAFVGTVTSTWIGADQYVDLLGALRWTGAHLEVEARAGARPWSRSPGGVGDAISGGYADLTAHVPLTARLALSLGGGTYPSDPARRVLAANYFSVGVRVRAFGNAVASDPRLDPGLLRWTAPGDPASAGGARLEITSNGELRTIRVHARGTRSVELMGDFTDWVALALAQVAPGVWEAELGIPPGVHRLNVRLDGGPWIVPTGTRGEPTEFGDAVGLVVVR